MFVLAWWFVFRRWWAFLIRAWRLFFKWVRYGVHGLVFVNCNWLRVFDERALLRQLLNDHGFQRSPVLLNKNALMHLCVYLSLVSTYCILLMYQAKRCTATEVFSVGWRLEVFHLTYPCLEFDKRKHQRTMCLFLRCRSSQKIRAYSAKFRGCDSTQTAHWDIELWNTQSINKRDLQLSFSFNRQVEECRSASKWL